MNIETNTLTRMADREDCPFRVSVIIPNYNFEAYLGAAIESALALDWPDVEVIVVDDGSTDGSRAIIERYAGRITAVLQANAKQRAACNRGFPISTGEMIIFLDSDDLLDPSLIREVAKVWRPGISKVQFQMQTIDAQGRRMGGILPQYHGTPTPQQIREHVERVGSYRSPPGSGNVYARDYLAKIFPLDNACGEAADTCCIAVAPLFGDVVTIPKPLVSYRIHDANDGAMSELDPARIGVNLDRGLKTFAYTRRTAKACGKTLDDKAFDRNLYILPYRMASLRLAPASHPIPGDSIFAILRDAARGMLIPQGLTMTAQVAILFWLCLVGLLPDFVAKNLVTWRFIPSRRPKILRESLGRLGIAGYAPVKH